MFGEGIAAIAHPVALTATRDNDNFPILKKGLQNYRNCTKNNCIIT